MVNISEALYRLIEGNQKYLSAMTPYGDISPAIRRETCENGQYPFAVIVTCSDSRVIPESIFSVGIGDLFVIRVAGNVIDVHQLGSVEYAVEHLGCKLVVVLGHTHCGAVDAAIHLDPQGYVGFITDEIKAAIGDETNDLRACCLNVHHSVQQIKKGISARAMKKTVECEVVGAVYHIEDGRVEFL